VIQCARGDDLLDDRRQSCQSSPEKSAAFADGAYFLRFC
jgi:hypothetical protein